MELEIKILFVICLGFILFSIILSMLMRKIDILARRIDELRCELDRDFKKIDYLYSRIDHSYDIVLARTNELSSWLSDMSKISADCLGGIETTYAALKNIEPVIYKCLDETSEINDCMNSVNDAVIPVIRSDHDILEDLKEKILTETEKETDNDN